jgi:hypothetical protein
LKTVFIQELKSNYIPISFFSKYSHDFIYAIAEVGNVKSELVSLEIIIVSHIHGYKSKNIIKKPTISYNIDLIS